MNMVLGKLNPFFHEGKKLTDPNWYYGRTKGEQEIRDRDQSLGTEPEKLYFFQKVKTLMQFLNSSLHYGITLIFYMETAAPLSTTKANAIKKKIFIQ